MQKWMVFTAGILGGLGLGVVLTAIFAEKYGVFCPVCNGVLVMEKNTIVCKSCGLKLKEES